jgi:hypothetical protein
VKERGRQSRLHTRSGGAVHEQAGKGDGSGAYNGGDPGSDVETGGHGTSEHPLKQLWREGA